MDRPRRKLMSRRYSLLIEQVTTIYEDVKAGLGLYLQGGERIREAVWEWRFGFRQHWGSHLVGALGALHAILSDHLLPIADDGGGRPA